MRLDPETRLGPYRILSPLGKGGMGEVYRAHDDRLARDVAIKIIPPGVAEDQVALRRFEREAKALASVTHPNIVTIHDVGSSDGIHFVVMEMLKGETLRSVMARRSLTNEEVYDITLQTAKGLAAAHARHVIHRDLKPENIILTSSGEVKLLDFGLALVESGFQDRSDEEQTHYRITHPNAVPGTVEYMSPEQLRGQPLDGRSDLFSLGIVMFEMLNGKRPFDGSTAAETASNIIHARTPPLAKHSKAIPRMLSDVVARCLGKEPEFRFASADELIRTLESVQPEVRKAYDPKFSLSKKYFLALAIIILAAVGGSFFSRENPPAESRKSIVVIPFENINKNLDTEFLSDGIAENLINNLSQIVNLKVIARTTAFTYKDKKMSPKEIGRELAVQTVVMGELQLRGDTLIVQVDLIDASNGDQLWGDRYTRSFKDVLELEKEISNEITAALHQKLTGDQQKMIGKIHTRNPEAWRLFLQGRYWWNQFTEETIQKSIQYYHQAIEKDPSYAMAYAGLSSAYGALGVNYGEPKEFMPLSKAAALRAIEIDPDLADAHMALAAELLFYERNWDETKKELDTALQLNPNLAVGYDIYAFLHEVHREFDEAKKKFERAIELDPLSGVFRADYGFLLYSMGNIQESIRVHRKAIELTPNLVMAQYQLGGVFLAAGQLDEAKKELEAACKKEPSAECLGRLGSLYVKLGENKEALRILEDMKQRIAEKKMQSFGPAFIYTAMGDYPRALDTLERTVEERSGWIVWMVIDPVFQPLHNEPRYKNILNTLRIPQN